MRKKLPTAELTKMEHRKHLRFHHTGEPAFLRAINSRDQVDFSRYKKIFQDPSVGKFLEGVSQKVTNKEVRDILNDKDETILFAVADAQDKNRRMQGWIQFIGDETQRLNRIKSVKEISNRKDHLILEISYARFTSSKQKKTVKGLLSSGVRQACLHAYALEKTRAEKLGVKPRKLVINAYVDKENMPSIRVLERSGFVRKGSVFYHNPKYKKYKDDEKTLYYKLSPKKLQEMLKSESN